MTTLRYFHATDVDRRDVGPSRRPAEVRTLPAAPPVVPSTQRMLPSLTALQAFERSAAQLSFRRAAWDLSLSPSAISHQIRNLEDHFGVRLFAREGRTVRLTAEGERFLDPVARALALLQEASRGLMHEGRGGRREVRVSALPFISSAALIPSLAEFERRFPDLTLRIEATHDYADFDHADVDVAIRYGREQASGLRLEPLLEVRGLPVCAPGLGAEGGQAARGLSDHVLIHMTRAPKAWDAWLCDAGCADLRPRGELWFDSLPAALDAAEHGLGVALAPFPLINGRRGFGETLVPAGALSIRTGTYYLACRPEQVDVRWIVAFRNWLAVALARATTTKAETV